MGSTLSSYWRSETVKPTGEGENSGGHENEPTYDPKSAVNGHSSDSGDEDTQQDQDGGNLDGKNDNELEYASIPVENSSTKDNFDHEECVSSANGGDDIEEIEPKEEHYRNGSNGVDDESCNEAMENGTNGREESSQIPIILLNNNRLSHEHSTSSSSQLIDSRNDFTLTNPAEQARITYASVSRNANKNLKGTHQRQNQLTLESRKREHSADSDRSTPNYQQGYLNEIPTAKSKKAKSSETDSVSSSRSDRASTEIEQITPKAAKTRKRRAKPAKKYLS